MAQTLLENRAFERFSPGIYGLAPGVTVTLHMPASGKRISAKRALIDTGSEISWIYPRDVDIDLASDVD